jgi:hypothetical protein
MRLIKSVIILIIRNRNNIDDQGITAKLENDLQTAT